MIRIDDAGLVSQIFRTLLEALIKQRLSLLLQDMSIVAGNTIPEFRAPKVEIIDGREFHVFCMPAE